MKKIYYIDIIFILILALAVGTALPVYVSYKQEQQLLNQIVVEEVATVQVSRTEKMEEKSFLEKFSFLMEDGIEYMEYAPAEVERTMHKEVALGNLENELQLLFDMGVLPSGSFDIRNAQLYMAANTNNPAQSLIVWQFLVIGGFEECYIITMDDATGHIISLNALWMTQDMEAFYGAAYEAVARFWGDYLGAADIRVTDIRYAGASSERMLVRMGNSRNQVFGLYGLKNEENLKELIQKKQDYVIVDAQTDTERTIVQSREGIELSVIYYLDDGTSVECVMEWDTNGYCFRRREEDKIIETR